MKNKKLKDFFKKIKKTESHHFGTDADRDWLMLCYTSFFLFLLIGLWSGYVYFTYNMKKEVDLNPTIAVSNILDKDGLEKVIERYKKKKEVFEETKTSNGFIVDPAF